MPLTPYGTWDNLVANPRPRADGARPDWAGAAPVYDPAADGGTPSWYGPITTTSQAFRFGLAPRTFLAGTRVLFRFRAWVDAGTAVGTLAVPGASYIVPTITTVPTTFVVRGPVAGSTSLGSWCTLQLRAPDGATVLHVSQLQVIPLEDFYNDGWETISDALESMSFWDGDSTAIDQPNLYRAFSWVGERARSASRIVTSPLPPGGSGKAALPVGCQLWVDGALIACHDERESGAPAAPYAMSGLSVTWGRGDITSDPEGATLGAEVTVPRGTLPRVPIGAHVDVLAIGYEDGDGTPVNSLAATDWNPFALTTGEWEPRFAATPTSLEVAANVVAPSEFTTYHAFALGMAQIAVGRAAPAIGHRPPFWTDLPSAGEAGEPWKLEASFTPLLGSTTNGSGMLSLRMGVRWAAGPILLDSETPGDWLGAGRATTAVGGNGWVTGDNVEWGPDQSYAIGTGAYAVLESVAPFPGAVPVLVFNVAGVPSTTAAYMRFTRVAFTPPLGTRIVPRTVFAGSITDSELVPPAEGFTDPTLVIQAVDDTSSLGQTKVGDQPWPAQDALARWAALTRVGAAQAGVSGYLDLEAPNWMQQWRDVDAQEWWGLAQDFARSLGGVAWPCYVPQSAPGRSALVVWVENPEARRLPSVLALQYGADGKLHVVSDLATAPLDADVTSLDTCNLDREPARFTQNLANIYTRVIVRYLVMNTAGDGTEQREVMATNPAAEARYGVRSLTVDTGLALEDEARELAYGWLARSAPDLWLVSGIRLADDALLELPSGMTSADLFLPLLDSLQRPGRSILITGLPDWTPAPTDLLALTLEGGTYSFVAGYWVLEMNVSTPTSGVQSDDLTWGEMGDTTWNDFGPEVRWMDLRGVRRIIP